MLAVAEGRVVTAKDRLPENIPGHGDAFKPAVPITLETVAGNTITLDLGGGQFAYYMHLVASSISLASMHAFLLDSTISLFFSDFQDKEGEYQANRL